MADIMMCEAESCPNRTFCRRSPASGTPVSPHYQSWWMRKDEDLTGDECPHFWATNPTPR